MFIDAWSRAFYGHWCANIEYEQDAVEVEVEVEFEVRWLQ
ncbi:hypothetical protein JCM19232_2942 [Vibrio ishigakensis]|uniref:Uncharacterized protein n=1 Tax=Vibrio ishigakensis TaxID=1481914 RepID=A0A0B8PN01_9VIBR|nr:hypothetical protein JCM19232_2942 [Vibrio ishigakensis]